MVPNQSPQSRKEPKWRILTQVSENMYILCSTLDGCVRYAPMYIHSFRLIAPRKLLEAQLFNQQYQNYEDMNKVALIVVSFVFDNLYPSKVDIADVVGKEEFAYPINQYGLTKVNGAIFRKDGLIFDGKGYADRNVFR